MVLGHAGCGAVKASISAQAVPGQISALYRYIRPAVDQAGIGCRSRRQGERQDPGDPAEQASTVVRPGQGKARSRSWPAITTLRKECGRVPLVRLGIPESQYNLNTIMPTEGQELATDLPDALPRKKSKSSSSCPDRKALERKLREHGFREETPPTHEVNTLYDLPGQKLRRKGDLLRLRNYGGKWKLTYKSKGKPGRHKTRGESETGVSDGETDAGDPARARLRAGLRVRESFAPSGATARARSSLITRPSATSPRSRANRAGSTAPRGCLGGFPKQYITKSYAELFFEWKRKHQ